MNICIFLPSGKTFSFHDCTITVDNESFLQFWYAAMSDGQQKEAHFPKTNIAGWSITYYEEMDPTPATT